MTTLLTGKSHQLVKFLIDHGADVNAVLPADCPDARRRLHRVLRTLIDAGGDLGAADDYGTALVYACGAGSLECVRMLIDAGADIHAFQEAREDGADGGMLQGAAGVCESLDRGGRRPGGCGQGGQDGSDARINGGGLRLCEGSAGLGG